MNLTVISKQLLSVATLVVLKQILRTQWHHSYHGWATKLLFQYIDIFVLVPPDLLKHLAYRDMRLVELIL